MSDKDKNKALKAEGKFHSTFDYKLIYVFSINDEKHRDCIKIGDATIHTDKEHSKLFNNCFDLNQAARHRIDQYTKTAGITYKLLHTELALYKVNNTNDKKYGQVVAFRDHNVHSVLKRSGVKNKYFDNKKSQNEWFLCDCDTAIKAITAVKNGKTALDTSVVSTVYQPIIFRPEQQEAIERTIKRFKKHNDMLWNAKMRFGKTLSALQVAHEMNFNKTIIITHRPVVSEGWYEDFNKIFYDKPNYKFGSKSLGTSTLEELNSSNEPFVYFASIQDLRGSSQVGGKFDKNDEVFNTKWDYIIVDEAHEGTQTKLGENVILELKNNKFNSQPKILQLSGTPFNILGNYEDEAIYTWDYIMEQQAKKDWSINHYGDSNPYEELPKLNIFTYHLSNTIRAFTDLEDKAFNFKEFFRVWTGVKAKDFAEMPNGSEIGDFVHEEEINFFLNLICKESNETNYPFSTKEYRDFFRHTLWVLPGVKEAKALSKLLKKHPIFSHFDIVNVAGDGDEEVYSNDALKAVHTAITNHPENTYTITLSCGRLTTGVSIKEWTAVLMLAGSYSTAASQYLQTIFRVQTPANINGKFKENCYVFDFAPDRTLKMIAESVQLSTKTKSRETTSETALLNFLNYCSVISVDGSNMQKYNVSMLLQELKKAYVERVVNSGFDDTTLYNDELMKLDQLAIEEFEDLKQKVGCIVGNSGTKQVEINNEGFSDAEYELLEKTKKLKKSELTEEQKKILEEIKEKKDNKRKAISILRAISIRMPLLVYGMEGKIDMDINIDNFVDLVDDVSWDEFMPNGVDKETFKKFTKYYDKDIFIGCARRIRNISLSADNLDPTERVIRIADLFKTFKNPDKETVLTPWRVVNLHITQTLGGYNFFNSEYTEELKVPVFVDNGDVTAETFKNKNARILEVNSKTGLYPLFVTYSLYRNLLDELDEDKLLFEDKLKLWDSVVDEQMYVICKTPMARSITKRTLIGYRKASTNLHAFDDLIKQLQDKPKIFVDRVKKASFWHKGGAEDMKFNAVVGNPPYQLVVKEATDGNNANTIDIYQYFQKMALEIANINTLIYPAKDLQRGKTNLMDKTLVKVRIYNGSSKETEKTIPGEPSVFGDAVRRIPGDVGVYLWNKNKPTDKINYQDVDIERVSSIMPVRREYFNLALKLQPYVEKSNSYNIRKCCESNFVQNNPNSIKGIVTDRNSNIPEGCVKVITNDKAGSGGKAKWYYILKEKLDYLQPEVYKVVIPSGFPNEAFKNSSNIEILDKYEMFGRTKMCIYYSNFFDDVVNYKKYSMTDFYRYIVEMTPQKFLYYLPDFDTIKDNINWDTNVDDINKQLYKYFNLK